MEDDEDVVIEARIVDVRPREEFLLKHLKGSVSFELATLGPGGGEDTRATELPSRSWPILLTVVGRDEEEMKQGIEWLVTRGWKVNAEESQSADKINWEKFKEEGLVEIGATNCKFWKASPPLERRSLGIAKLVEESRPAHKERWCLDLGCGSGRDAVFLATRGWNVLAVDREEAFLEKVRSFSKRENVSHLVTTQLLDLRPQFLEKNLLPVFNSRKFDLIHMSRFMNRPLLAVLSQIIPPLTFVAVHHFLVGAQSRHGKPFRQGVEQTLCPGELTSQFFTQPRYQIFMNEESTLVDGRPIVNFICRRTETI